MKKVISSVLAALTTLTAAVSISGSVSAKVIPNPVISRNCPAYSGNGQASAGNDEHYFSFWSSAAPDYLAYDLSGVPDSEKKQVIAVWYNTSSFEKMGSYASMNGMPTDYTIEVNKAEGGSYPEDSWEIAETVSGNTFASRQHIINMEGYNWIRLNITKADNEEGKQASVNFDIHNVTEGVSDSWLFLGDSITAIGMNNCYGTGFATHVNSIDNKYFPIQENGGIGGIRSIDGRNNIDRWLSVSCAEYVSIAYGTNDAWGNPNGTDAYYDNTKYMIDAILAAGKKPVLPKIPSSTNNDVMPNVPLYNEVVDKLYEEYGEKLIKGPDFDAFFKENPDYLSSDGVHPSDVGCEAMRKLWAETMYNNVYNAPDTEQPPEDVTGDVNADGKFSSADMVAMSNWLLKSEALADGEKADLTGDEVVDVFDMCLMRRMLIGAETDKH